MVVYRPGYFYDLTAKTIYDRMPARFCLVLLAVPLLSAGYKQLGTDYFLNLREYYD